MTSARLSRLFCCSLLVVRLAGYLAAAEEPQINKQELLWNKLDAAIAKIDRELDAAIGVAVLDLRSGKLLLRNGEQVFPTASSIKIAVLAELYHQQEQTDQGTTGKARLTDSYTVQANDLVPDSNIMAGLTPDLTRLTNRDLATLMIVVSDNAAANILIGRLGIENINALLEDLGLKQTRLRRKMMDIKAAREGRENTSTPAEMVRLLESLYQNKVVNKALTNDLFKLLSTPKQSYLPRYLPEAVSVANKPGDLSAVRTDSGVVFAGNRPFAISVMTSYARDERTAEDSIAKIGLLAYQHFEVLGRASEYGRIINP